MPVRALPDEWRRETAIPVGELRNSDADTTRTTFPFASRIVTGAMESSFEGSRTELDGLFMS